MKKTHNINLGGVPFIIDEDAYHSLDNYLDEIGIRLDGSDDNEVLDDIESRIADIFKEEITSPKSQVVSIALVRRAIAIIGNANEFGEPKHTFKDECENPKPLRLYRSRDEKIIGGVCGGIAEYFNADPTVIRIITFLLVFLGGLSLWVYIILWIVIPLKPYELEDQCHKRKNKRK